MTLPCFDFVALLSQIMRLYINDPIFWPLALNRMSFAIISVTAQPITYMPILFSLTSPTNEMKPQRFIVFPIVLETKTLFFFGKSSSICCICIICICFSFSHISNSSQCQSTKMENILFLRTPPVSAADVKFKIKKRRMAVITYFGEREVHKTGRQYM